MLKHLSIKNYALIDVLEIDFVKGFNIITGETGAGKSILLGGLSLVLGKRADLGQIKDRSKKCVVEAIIKTDDYQLVSLFDAYDLDYDEQVILRRELLASGKSRAFVNDTPVTLEVLNAVSSKLIDIHSQNQTAQLTDTNFLFAVLDGIGNNVLNLKDYTEHWKQYQDNSKEIDSLKLKLSESNRIKDYNNYLLEELNVIKISADQFVELEEQQRQLEHSELIQQRLQFGMNVLTSDQFGVLERLKELKRHLDDISGLSATFLQIHERVISSILELEDLASELQIQENRVASNPQQLDELNTTMETVNQLLLKHHVHTFEDLMKIKENLQQEYESTINLEDRISASEKENRRLEAYLVKLSRKISESRLQAIPNISSALEGMLRTLGMPNAKFNIQVLPDSQLFPNGSDRLEFKFTANKGSDFREMKVAASGGELSRIMLSIKAILAEHIKLPTLVFDEIDTGVSGDVADKMGEIMMKMSQHFQLLSITHLPQVAAKGDAHFKVFKTDDDIQTITQVKHLNQEERVDEIALMLGGEKLSESAIAHAKQLLN